MAYRMPGRELEELVQKSKDEYDAWESKQRSVGCVDRHGHQLVKPQPMLGGYAKGVGADRWLEMWCKLTIEHKQRCVKCGEEPEDGRAEGLQAENPPPEVG
jgi:hypothetical protein